MSQQYTPGPNLLSNILEGAPATLTDAPAVAPEMTLQERLRKYSPTSGYARYTAMAADRIDELTQMGLAQQSQISRLKAILEERNYKVHALTVENEHHRVNEDLLLQRSAQLNKECRIWEADCTGLEKQLIAAEAELYDIAERNLIQTIIHYFRSK